MNKQILVGVLLGGAMFALSGCALFGGNDEPEAAGAEPVALDENGVALNRIPGTEAIDIPAGLANDKVLDAVEMAITGTRPGERNISAVSQWRPEMRDPENRWIQVGLRARMHYLCVCYRIEGSKLIPDVPTSRNLKQKGTSIHRKVPIWINNFSSLIKMQLYGIVNGNNCTGRVKNESGTAKQPVAFCQHCGAKVGEAANFCSSCGKALR